MAKKTKEDVTTTTVTNEPEVFNVSVVDVQLESPKPVTEKAKPEIGSPEWTEYVLSLLNKDELVDGRPRASGLRRVTKILFPRMIVSQMTDVIHCERDYAVIRVRLSMVDSYNGEVCTTDGVGECSPSNTDSPYAQSPAATAETKAEGRAYKKFLNINILAEEEHSRIANNSIPMTFNEIAKDTIKPEQIIFTEVICRDHLKVSVNDAITTILGVNKDIASLTLSDAEILLDKLGEWRRDKTTMPTLPPFVANWKNK